MTEPICEQTMLTKMAEMQRTIERLEKQNKLKGLEIERLCGIIYGTQKDISSAIDRMKNQPWTEKDIKEAGGRGKDE